MLLQSFEIRRNYARETNRERNIRQATAEEPYQDPAPETILLDRTFEAPMDVFQRETESPLITWQELRELIASRDPSTYLLIDVRDTKSCGYEPGIPNSHSLACKCFIRLELTR